MKVTGHIWQSCSSSSFIVTLSLIQQTACARAQFSRCSSMTNADSETRQMAVCCQNLPLGALSSRSALSVLVGVLIKKFSLFFWTRLVEHHRCNKVILMSQRSSNLMVKLFLSTQWRHIEEAEVQFRTFLALALDGGEWSMSYPGHFTPRKEMWALSQSGQSEEEKNPIPLPGFEPQIIQPIA
jgi:hypothetical protein